MEPTAQELAYDAVVGAPDISTLAANTSTILVALIGVALLFVAYRYIRKAGIR